MAIAVYNDLKTKAASWLRRSGNATYVAEVPDMITLAEGRLNAELGPLETNVTLTGSVGSRSLDISSYTIVEPIALWITPASGDDEDRLDQQSPANMNYLGSNGRPRQWAYDSEDAIKLDCPCDTAYSFRFRHRGRFALSASSTTNWLLENRPDVYLAAALGWGSAYLENFKGAATWMAFLDTEIPKVAHTLAKGRKGTLTVDPALGMIGHVPRFNYTTGQ
jgi:hypothetical protein